VLFPTPTFAIFLLIVLPLSWALMSRQPLWRPCMLAASYVFYAWWDWKFVFLLAASTIVNHVLAVAIFRASGPRLRRAYLIAAVSFDLGLLGYFKYAGFFVSSAENFLTRLGIAEASAVVHVALPVGISFYTFMAISYVVDTYRGELEPATFSRFAVFLSFFPHLVAGPIVRASELLPQLERPRDPRRVDTTRAYYLILTGLFLKVVIANHLATHIVDDVFAAPNRHSSLETLFGIYGYAVQIFADFCGYTNIAIGVALLLGFEFPQNFAGRIPPSRCRTSGDGGT
jgi:D-alanyl-lipoteichoic acid acyltransferase DltB (MBOAT superfamily)